jgi:hypothetical protein
MGTSLTMQVILVCAANIVSLLFDLCSSTCNHDQLKGGDWQAFEIVYFGRNKSKSTEKLNKMKGVSYVGSNSWYCK